MAGVHQKWFTGSAVIAAALILFSVDIMTAPGLIDGIGYPSVVVTTLLLPGRLSTVAMGVAATALTVAAYFLSPEGGIGAASLVNRTVSIALIWTVVALVLSRKAGDLRLSQALAEAERSNVAKTNFLATMSHELRTPLNAILGFSDALCLEIFGPLGSPRNKEYVQGVRHSARLLLDLVNDLLDITRIENNAVQIRLESFPLGACLDDARGTMIPLAIDKAIDLQWIFPEALPAVRGDRRLLEQTLLNVLSNAVKFTPQGGTVRVEALAADEGMVVLVRDSGVGIPGDVLARIGQPFLQAAADDAEGRGGAGLGLSIAKAFVERMGGVFAIESTPGAGTAVRIMLPRG